MSNAQQVVSSPLNNGANATVAANIRGELARMGSTQGQLAQHLGASDMSISRRMKGYNDFTASEIAAIADYLEVDPGELFVAKKRKNAQITERSLAVVTYLRPDTQPTVERDTIAPVTRIGA